MIKRILFLAILFAFLTGCLEQSGSDQNTIPDVTVECSSAQVYSPYCRSSGDRLWIGITNEFTIDCANILSTLPRTQRNQYFLAVAEDIPLSYSGFLARANVTNWTDSRGSSMVSLQEGTYKICAFIESSSGNKRLGAGEPLGAGLLTVGGPSPQIVNDWISY